jgi:hypothetical protein
VERRVDRLADLWNAVSDDPDVRLVRWLVDPDERRLLDVFAALENEEVGQTADGFLKFAAPFTDVRRYAEALLDELAAHYEASREGLLARGLTDDWCPPEASSGEGAGRRFLRAADALAARYPDRLDRLVLYLAPAHVADGVGWRTWLERLLQAPIPASLRVMVADAAEAPLLAGLDARFGGRAVALEPRLDMAAAMSELARAEGEDGPAKSLRNHLVALASAARVKNGEAAQGAAGHALEVAREQRWPDQEVVVHMAMGAARLATGEHDLAACSYRDALEAAGRALAAEHPAAAKLRLAAGMGLAGAILAAARWSEAAQAYEAAAPLAAEAAGDGVMVLEAWRMASHCHAQAGAAAAAWRCGRLALDAGADLPDELRQASTLPWAAQTLLRLIEEHPERDRYAASVGARMEALLGPGWEARLEPARPAP